MENREKLEIPTIVFTPVTLLSGSSSCDCTDNTNGGTTTGLGCVDNYD